MTIYINLEDKDVFERFVSKYNEILKKENENFDLIKVVKELNKEGEQK